MTDRSSLKHRLLSFFAPRLAHVYLSFVGATSSVTWHGAADVDTSMGSGSNVVLALWHNRQAFFTWSHRGRNIATLVSRSKDGDIIAGILTLGGHRPVRGSTSRGGAAALKELVDAGKEGHTLAVTPDGPRGPAFTVQSGALFLARELAIPIIPIANGLKHKLEAGSWDRLQFPLPFNKVAIVYGPPVLVKEGDDLEAKAEELRVALDKVTAEADRLAHS